MGKSNFPQSQLDDVEPSKVQEITTSLMDLFDLGKPETDEEVEERVKQYFSFCQQSSIRPGVESLAMSLHISRQTLFNWSNGIKCSEKRAEIIQDAKQVINAFLEQCVMGGKISPPSGIFLLKNYCNYRDTISIEDNLPIDRSSQILNASSLPIFDDQQGISETPPLPSLNDGQQV